MARSAACRTIPLPTPVAGRSPTPVSRATTARPTRIWRPRSRPMPPIPGGTSRCSSPSRVPACSCPCSPCPATSRSTRAEVGPARRPVTWPPCSSRAATAVRRCSASAASRRLAAWRTDARPVPVAAPLVARSALEAGAAALVVDLAGPTTYVVAGRPARGPGPRDGSSRTRARDSPSSRRSTRTRFRNRHPSTGVVTLVTDRSDSSRDGSGPTSGGSLPPASTAPGRRVRSAP